MVQVCWPLIPAIPDHKEHNQQRAVTMDLYIPAAGKAFQRQVLSLHVCGFILLKIKQQALVFNFC